jgi:hypothetical protein
MVEFTPSSRSGFVRWSEDDCLMYVCAALPLVEGGQDLVDALEEVQRTIMPPDKRQPTREDLVRRTKASPMQKALSQARRLSRASRVEQVERLRRERLLSELNPVAHIFWTDTEWAQVYRRCMYWKRDLGDTRSIVMMACHAQMVELPYERWRKRSTLQANYGPKLAQGVEARFKGVAPRADELLKGIPFEPGKTSLNLPSDEPPGAQPEEELVQESPPAVITQVFEPVPEPPARSLRDIVKAAGYTPPPEPARRSQERAIRAEATLPSPHPSDAPYDPIEALVRQGVGALRGLIDAISTHQAAHAETTYRRVAEAVMIAGIEALDTRIQQLIPLAVQAALEKHLGPGVDVPKVDLPPLKVDLVGAGLEARLKLDVVGLFPRQITEVKKALNGYADGVRFIEAGEIAASWVPRDIVLANTKVSGHVVETKCRKHNVHLQRVWGTTSAVVNAIKELYAQNGVNLSPH